MILTDQFFSTIYHERRQHMAMDPIIAIAKASALQDLLDAPEWTYCGSTSCTPTHDEIRLPGSRDGMTAWAVYDMLDLDITELCRVYGMDDFFSGPKLKQRCASIAWLPNEPDSGFYQILKFRSCYWNDFRSWMILARLTGRNIVFHRRVPSPGQTASEPVATFHPDGRIDESPTFLSCLNDRHSFWGYQLFKAGLPGIKVARR